MKNTSRFPQKTALIPADNYCKTEKKISAELQKILRIFSKKLRKFTPREAKKVLDLLKFFSKKRERILNFNENFETVFKKFRGFP